MLFTKILWNLNLSFNQIEYRRQMRLKHGSRCQQTYFTQRYKPGALVDLSLLLILLLLVHEVENGEHGTLEPRVIVLELGEVLDELGQ